MTDYLSRHAPGPAVALAPAIGAGRAALAEAAAELLTVPDSALEASWPWRGESADVRYGLYRIVEALEEAAGDVGRAFSEGAAQRAYGDGTAWWLEQPADAAFPTRLPEAVVEDMAWPTEEEDGTGSLAEIRARLDDWLDLDASLFSTLGDTELARRGRWSGVAVDVGFRLGRWASHLAEHTLQVDKTLVLLGRNPTEVERLVRLIHAAWGRLEALAFPMPSAMLERTGEGHRSAATIIVAAAAEMKATAASVRAAAEAGATART